MGNRKQFKNKEDWDRYYNNEKERNRVNQKLDYEESKLNGRCYKCEKKCQINFKTGKLYAACTECRDKEAKRTREFRRKNNNEYYGIKTL